MKPTSNLLRWLLLIAALLGAGGVGDFAHPASHIVHPHPGKEPAAVGLNSVCPKDWVQTSGIDPNTQPASGRGVSFFVCAKTDKTEVTVWSNGRYSGFDSTGRALNDTEARGVFFDGAPGTTTGAR